MQKLLLLRAVLFSMTAWSAPLMVPEWTYDAGQGVLQPVAFPSAARADGILLTGSSGKIVLVAPGGTALAEMRLDLQPSAEAIPVVFHAGEEARIVAADVGGSTTASGATVSGSGNIRATGKRRTSGISWP
ncbi:MAG TPA: hypothetical protein VG672_29505 [Bryobacteraceae bacterium]|nr:hypothetical protein [Bryobacteraceae bacterium]